MTTRHPDDYLAGQRPGHRPEPRARPGRLLDDRPSSASSDHRAARGSGRVPVLGRGRHEDFRHGACVMEYVSLLAGEPFSDQPACTHPALAALARGINDRLTDATRPALLTRAPVLAAIGPRIPGVAAVTATAALADLSTGDPGREHGPGRGPGPWELCKVERRLAGLVARDRPGRGWWGRHRDQVLARQLIHVGLDRARRLPPGLARDDVMLRLLDQALLAIPRHAHAPS